MGKLTLMIVAAAILGGATLKLGMDLIAGDTAAGRAEGQADVLARQIAETGQSVALAAMVDDTGFRNPGDETRSYEGGEYEVHFDNLSADNTEITVTVEGRYGGAVHTIQSTYAFDPMEYPGPIWLDVPYATASIGGGPANRISGDMNDHPVRYDQRKFEDLGLGSYGMNRATMEGNLQGQLGVAGGTLSSPAANQWSRNGNSQPGPLLEDLSQDDSVIDGEGLYQAALSSMDGGDVTFATGRSVSGNQTWGGPEKVTRVMGDLIVRGRLSGSGVLLVEGVLDVRATGGARLDWDGLVIVRADQQLLPVKLNGDADIHGSLVVVQNAFPPGGHMDLTVMRGGNSGMITSPGARPSPNWPLASPVDFPWWEHTHRFDLEPVGSPRGGHVEFARNGRGAQEDETQFWTTLQSMGAEPVYLEFKNPQAHGFSRFTLGLSGQPEVRGSVRAGFGAFASPGNRHRSQVFPANELRTLMLDVQSLRALKDRFDGVGSCDGGSWPFCIGRDWGREGAFSVRLVRENHGTAFYDAALYWHMKADERAQHDAEEAAWLATLASGGSFGTHLEMGPRASVTYDHGNISRLTEKLSFDGNEVRLLSSVSEHVSAAELRGALASGQPNPTTAPTLPAPNVPGIPSPTPTPGTPATTPATTPTTSPVGTTAPTELVYAVCHGGSTVMVASMAQVETHVASHGDTAGACPVATPVVPESSTPAQVAPSCPDDDAQIAMCNKPNGAGVWRNVTRDCDAVSGHLNHGCRIGSCAENGLPTSTAQLQTTCPNVWNWNNSSKTWICN